MTSLCPQLTKAGLHLDFCSFLPGLPSHTHYWTMEGSVYRERFPTSIAAADGVPQ